ncbi:MAG TPA: RNA polymerase sigma factor [Aggregatilineales bacterium]|nr:RNA polymerase sigma factor [Aggregatilineales bacterium]
MLTDEQLASHIKKGDGSALAALVERHHGLLLGYLYRMTDGNRALAEDLVQEAFIHVLKGIAGYTYPRPFKPWLYAIATNLARSLQERRRSPCRQGRNCSWRRAARR